MTSALRRLRLAAVGVALAMLGLACAGFEPSTSSQPTPVQTLGFLERYDELAPGRAGQARLIFSDSAVDFSRIERMIIDPVVAWHGREHEEHLARSFGVALREQLATEFDLVESPQAGTLRLRSALAMKTPSLLGIEVELLDATSGTRVVAAVDERPVSGVDHERARAQREAELRRWAGVIRSRLAAFRSFDAAQRIRGEEEAP